MSLPVVPNAFGFGMNTRAAYGGPVPPSVLRVTNVNDSGAGSLRAAVEGTLGPRVVIFETSGNLQLQSDLIVTDSYLTVAGETAPSPGITLRGAPGTSQSAGGFSFYGAHDCLISHLRCRPGDGPPVLPETAAHDAYLVYISNGGQPSYNIVYNHVSSSWTGDKLMNLVPGPPANITVWRSIMSEPFYYASNVTITPGNPSSLGMLIGGTAGGGNVSVFQSLFAHCSDRNPEIHDGSVVHFINNVVYDWGKDTTNYQWATLFYAPGSGGPWLADFIGNQYIAGGGTHPFTPLYLIGTYSGVAGSSLYMSDNAIDQTQAAVVDYINYMGFDPRVGTPPVSLTGITVMPSSGVKSFVLSNAGARPLDRDAVDTRIVNEVTNYTGNVISSQNDVGGWPALTVNTRALTTPANYNNPAPDGSGYTILERWLQGFASALEPGGTPPPPTTPTITSTSGSIGNGGSFVLTGTHFGTKSTVAPIGYTDCSSGSVPGFLTEVPADPAANQILHTNTSNLRTSFVTKNWRLDFKLASGSGTGGAFYRAVASDSSKWFTHYWIKLASNWHWGTGGADSGLSSVFWWASQSNSTFYPLLYTFNRSYNSTDFVGVDHQPGPVETDYGPITNLSSLPVDTWHLIQVQHSDSSSPSAADGHVKIWFDGSPIIDSQVVITSYSADNSSSVVNKRPSVIGLLDAVPPSSAAVANMYAYMGEIYVDNSWSRVEVGNAATYDTCTHREVQTPTAWSDTSVTIAVNQGSFSTLSGTYLYVIDSNGNASPGFPISSTNITALAPGLSASWSALAPTIVHNVTIIPPIPTMVATIPTQVIHPTVTISAPAAVA